MKLILLAPGYENFSGVFGMVEFENGRSVDDVAPVIAKRISGIVTCVWEDGSQLSVAEALLANANMPAPTESATAPVEVREDVAAVAYWTEEELGKIADAKGIAGVREIAEPAGIRGNSISGLIKAIVKQGVAKTEEA